MRHPKQIPDVAPPPPPMKPQPSARWEVAFYLSILFVATAAIVTAMVAAACGPASVPPSGPGTQYPCGLQWFECPVQQRGEPLACCPLNHICGGPDPAGFSRCEPGFCCFDGDGASVDAGARVVPMKRVP